MKVKVEFPASFENNEVSPIQLGRLYLGNAGVRIVFDKDGLLKLLIPQSAIKAGTAILWDDSSPASLFEFKNEGG